jgi:hypothetical protein
MNDDENEFFRSRHYVPRDRPPFHPLADHFPMMDRTSPEFKGLVASIRANGLWEPITMHQGKVLDGRNRLLACEEARIEPRFEDFDDTETTALDRARKEPVPKASERRATGHESRRNGDVIAWRQPEIVFP